MSTDDLAAFVTGGGSGIGLAVARALLQRGWNTAICGRDASKLSRAADELEREDPGRTERLFTFCADVSNEEEVQRWIEAASDRCGPPALLVNNAGVGGSGEVASLRQEEWDRVLAINLKGTFLCSRAALPRMRKRGGGWIVNIASLAGKRGFAGSSAYCASKFGMIGFTESLAREEAANNIRATAICPGYVATPMVADADVPASQMIQPEDVAATVLYLLDLSPHTVIREIVIERIGGL